jgi:hypothetical protein
MCAPSDAVPVMLALRFHVYESEAVSTMLLTTLAMIVATPLANAWAGAEAISCDKSCGNGIDRNSI